MVLAALWLRGAPRAAVSASSGWAPVLRVLRQHPCSANDSAELLRMSGLWSEATVLDTPGLIDWAREQLSAGRCVTPADDAYPKGWLNTLRERAPAAVWVEGDLSARPTSEADDIAPKWLAVVGSRRIDYPTARFTRDIGRAAAALGMGVVSGGANGCDSAAAFAAESAGAPVVEILPCGLNLARGRARGVRLSACAPDEEFRSATAMERNALIYAFAPYAVVCHARYKEGGTWHGAVDAIRRRLCRFIVRDLDTAAHRALIALGGIPLSHPDRLAAAMSEPPIQEALFDLG